MSNRREISAVVFTAVVCALLFLSWIIGSSDRSSLRTYINTPNHSEEGNNDQGKLRDGLAPVIEPTENKPRNPIESCRKAIAAGILDLRLVPPTGVGSSHVFLASIHRSSSHFNRFVREFCDRAGRDLLPICKQLIEDSESSASKFLLSAILGHAKPPGAFAILKDMVEYEKDRPDPPDVLACAYYSIGMIGAPESGPFLLKAFNEANDASPSLHGHALMSAMGLSGNTAVPVLRELARKNLEPEDQPEPAEGLRVFQNQFLGFVSSPGAFNELVAIAQQESDQRIRAMAIAAIGQSTDVEQRKFLGDLYLTNTDPLVRRAIVDALRGPANSYPEEWARFRPHLDESISSILKATPLPSGYPGLDYALITLASHAKSEESAKYIDSWISKCNTRNLYGDSRLWAQIAASAMGAQDANSERIRDFLLAVNPTHPKEQMYLVLGAYRQREFGSEHEGNLERIRTFLRTTEKPDAMTQNTLSAMRNVESIHSEVNGAIDRMMERAATPLGRIDVIEAAEGAGQNALTSIERIMTSSADTMSVLHASKVFLRITDKDFLPSNSVMRTLQSFYARDNLENLDIELLASNMKSPAAFAEGIGLYYSRFGRVQDVAWLRSLPGIMFRSSRIADRSEDRFRERLTRECTRAIDCIKWRADDSK